MKQKERVIAKETQVEKHRGREQRKGGACKIEVVLKVPEVPDGKDRTAPLIPSPQ